MGPDEAYKKSSAKVTRLLDEALRRWQIHPFGGHCGGETLATAWLGLGTEAEYRLGVKVDYFLPVHPGDEGRGINQWWQLTYKGAEIVAYLMGKAEVEQRISAVV